MKATALELNNLSSRQNEMILQWGARLVDLLEQLFERYGAVAETAKRQRSALIRGKQDEIESVNQEAESLSSEISFIEVERAQLAARLYALVQGRDIHPRESFSYESDAQWDAPVKAETLMPFLPSAVAKAMMDVRIRLRERLMDLRKEFAVNATLAENGRRIVHASMSLITSVIGREGPDKHQFYGQKGKAQFARTQVRSILNKKV